VSFRWGVIAATARVAQKAVLPAIVASSAAELVAVASEPGRPVGDPEEADPPEDGHPAGERAGAGRRGGAPGGRGGGAGDWRVFGARRVHDSYAALLDDPDVEAVYVPLPNALHRPWVERAAAAGKHVLCEKPLGVDAADARAMAAACAAAGVVLLEAYVTPFHPRTAAVDSLIRAGRHGALRFARAVFTSALGRPGDHRWRPEMGGGALLDVGTYCLAPLLAAAGRPPVRVAAAAARAPSGVDAAFAGWLDFGRGFTAAIECSLDAPERQSLEIAGTEAAVTVDRAHTPGPRDVAYTLRTRDGRTEEIVAGGADPYQVMIEHFAAVARGRIAPLRPAGESVALLAVLDRLRAAARRRGGDPPDAAPPGTAPAAPGRTAGAGVVP
jgi:predicted dehydrogenase